MTGTRSQGCGTCRRRKVKCDESKPTCNRCIKAKVECLGYHRSVVFIDDWKKRKDGSSSYEQTLIENGHQKQITMNLWLGPQMTMAGLRRDQYISFLTSKLFSQRKADDMQAWYAIRLKDLPTPGLALDALVTYFYGRYNQIADITRQGVAYYSKALTRLRGDLQGPEAYSTATLMTTVLLSMYELIGYSSDGGWIHHAGGLARLIEARGPDSHKTGSGKSVFLDQRTLMISEAVLQKKRSFLSKPEWKTIPWSEDPSSRTPFDYLLDITADGAGYSEESEILSSASHEADIRDLANRINGSLDQLDSWWRGWATKLVDNVTEVPPDPSLNVSFDEEGPIFHKIIKYNDFWTCYVTVCHHATRILLLRLLAQVRVLGASKNISFHSRAIEYSPLPLAGITSDVELLSIDILRAVESFETGSKRFLGAYCLLFPFTVVQQSLVPGSREAKWLYSLPGKNMASYRRAAGEQDHGSALPTCGCMMIDSVVSSTRQETLI